MCAFSVSLDFSSSRASHELCLAVPTRLRRGRHRHRCHRHDGGHTGRQDDDAIRCPLLLAAPLAASCLLIEGKRTFLKRTSVPFGGPFCLNYNIWSLPKETTSIVGGLPLRRVLRNRRRLQRVAVRLPIYGSRVHRSFETRCEDDRRHRACHAQECGLDWPRSLQAAMSASFGGTY